MSPAVIRINTVYYSKVNLNDYINIINLADAHFFVHTLVIKCYLLVWMCTSMNVHTCFFQQLSCRCQGNMHIVR